jgi:hypothetical protein
MGLDWHGQQPLGSESLFDIDRKGVVRLLIFRGGKGWQTLLVAAN